MAGRYQNTSILFAGGNEFTSSEGIGHGADQSRIFRAIGQDLEAKAIATFCLRLAEGRYFVRGLRDGVEKPARRANSIWKKFRNQGAVSSEALELSYSMDDIERLDAVGRARRGSANGMPDFLALPQQLRALAAMIDRKGGEITRLDRIAYEGMIPAIAIDYKTLSGGHASEEHTASNLYDYCVHMYKTRNRHAVAASIFEAA